MPSESRAHQAAYWRQWYANGGTAAQRQRLSQTANDRARGRLVLAHPDEYRCLVDEEREALGLPPSKRSPGPYPKAKYVPPDTMPEDE